MRDPRSTTCDGRMRGDLRLAVHNETLIARALRRIGQVFCAHDFILEQDGDDLFLICPKCWKTSQGVEIRRSIWRQE